MHHRQVAYGLPLRRRLALATVLAWEVGNLRFSDPVDHPSCRIFPLAIHNPLHKTSVVLPTAEKAVVYCLRGPMTAEVVESGRHAVLRGRCP